MAYVYVRTKKDAERVASIMTEAHGFQPTIFRDGPGYRVQHDEIGSDAMRDLLRAHGLERLIESTF